MASGFFSNVASGARLEALDGGESFEVRFGEVPAPGRVIAKSFLVPEPATLALSIIAPFSIGVGDETFKRDLSDRRENSY